MIKQVTFLKKSTKFSAEKHGFHLVRPSPWPFCTSMSLLNLIIYSLLIFNDYNTSLLSLILCFWLFLSVIGMWFRDIVIEATFQGKHTWKVQRGLRMGMIIFLLSETMFFFGFFWCFFYMSVSPSVWIGCTWPPAGIIPLDPTLLPLLNTIILISSGISANFSHKSMLVRHGRYDVMIGLGISIFFGILFTGFQLWEYSLATFSINDGIYGSIFYVSTGFHGLHVIIGTTALIVCLIRHICYHFTMEHHLGFEFSLWYWHFVDIVWILLYLCIYCWGYRY
jgi:cytochrome c oxidase subunit 3